MRIVGLIASLFATAALAAEPTLERIPVLNMQLDGKVKLETVRLPVAPLPWQNYVCIREFDAKAIRCYILNGDSMEVMAFDLTIAE